jgi:hypothetical protein
MNQLTEQESDAIWPRDPRAHERKAYRYARACLSGARYQLADAAHGHVLGSRFEVATSLRQATTWLLEAAQWREDARKARRERLEREAAS